MSDLNSAEAILVKKYSKLSILPGSLKLASKGKYKGKRTVSVNCPKCKAMLVRATSDLWHLKSCSKCK